MELPLGRATAEPLPSNIPAPACKTWQATSRLNLAGSNIF